MIYRPKIHPFHLSTDQYLCQLSNLSPSITPNAPLSRRTDAHSKSPSPDATPAPRKSESDSTPTSRIQGDSLIGDGTKLGVKTIVKRSVIGKNCQVRGLLLSGLIFFFSIVSFGQSSCLSQFLSVVLSIYFFLFVIIYDCLPVCSSSCLSPILFFFLSVCLFSCLSPSVCLSSCFFLFPFYLCLFSCLSLFFMSLFFHVSVFLPVCLSLSVLSSVFLSSCLFSPVVFLSLCLPVIMFSCHYVFLALSCCLCLSVCLPVCFPFLVLSVSLFFSAYLNSQVTTTYKI